MHAERSLGIVLTHADTDAVQAAFMFAAGAAALGRQVWLFATGNGVLALTQEQQPPFVVELRDACCALGVRLSACPSGLVQTGLSAGKLMAGASEDGLASFLEATRDAQLISF
ncbi:MAG: DsrE family protein [Acidocella sp.]|nr:DsrE family protein [Acidocella sp.]